MEHRQMKHLQVVGETDQPVVVMEFESEVQRRVYVLLKEVEGVRSTILRPNYRVRYIDKNGEFAYQSFDVHSEFVDGKSVATAVMPLSKYARSKLLTRLEAGHLVRDDGTVGRLSEGFTWMAIVSEDWVNTRYENPHWLPKLAGAKSEK